MRLVLAIGATCLAVSAVAAQRSAGSGASTVGPVHRFAAGSSARDIKFDLINNLVLVQARVNSSAPLWFIFDTGASYTVIDTKRANALGLKTRGKVSGSASAATVEAGRVPNVTVDFPGFQVSQLTVYTLDVDGFSALFGVPISGIIGNDIIGRVVVEIDYEHQKLNFIEGANYRYQGKGQLFPATLMEGLPLIQARFELGNRTFSGTFEIDSGSTGAIQINSPFVARERLSSLVTQSKSENMGGVGGSAKAIATRFQAVEFGPYRLLNPIGKLSLSKEGDYASRRYDGLLGGQIFRRFKLVVDLGRRQVIFEPNGALNDTFEADMSGLEIVADGDDLASYLIDDIDPNSPATEAGLKGGETLVAIDDRPVAGYSLEQIRRLFMIAGREHNLTLKRDGNTVRVKLKLRRLV